MADEFRTRELHEASALALFTKPIRLEYDAIDSKIIFIFPEEAKENSNKYWNNELKVDAREYANSFKEMKIRLFAFKKREEENQ